MNKNSIEVGAYIGRRTFRDPTANIATLHVMRDSKRPSKPTMEIALPQADPDHASFEPDRLISNGKIRRIRRHLMYIGDR